MAFKLNPLPPWPRPSSEELEEVRARLPVEQQIYARDIWFHEFKERQPEAVFISHSRFVADWARYGVTNYEGYLQSDLWHEIKTRVLSAANYRCAAMDCSVLANQVHHRSYDHATLSGRYDEYLVPLCEYHHRLLHWTARGGYRDPHFDQEEALRALVEGEPLDPLTADEWRLLHLAARPQGIGPGYTQIPGKPYAISPDGLIAVGALEKVATTFDENGPCGWTIRATPAGRALLEHRRELTGRPG